MNRETLQMLARQVTPFNAQKYLLAKGWKLVAKNPRQDILLFNHRRDRFKQIIIPKTDDYELYSKDLLRAVLWLEEEELRDSESIIRQMITPDADILRYKIQSSQVESGTLSLTSIQDLVSSVIASLSAAVCDVFSPGQLHHSKTTTKQVKRLLDKAQFGQTEHGSFVIKIIAPLDNLDDRGQSFLEVRDGGIRQGVVHLLTSIQSVVSTIENGTTKRFIQKGLADPPFSNNLINSFLEMRLWEDTSIEISSEWAPSLQPDKRVPSLVSVRPDYFGEMEKISSAFSPKTEENPVEYFSGFVTELRGETNESGNKYGDVIVQLTRSDGDSFPATVWLSEDLHMVAIRGYEKNIPVYLSGRLVWESGRRKQVRDVGTFHLCGSEDKE